MDNKLIKEVFTEIGLPLSEKQIKQFERYYKLLVIWNKKINLTTIIEERDVLLKHFIDSILAYKIVDFEKYDKLIDVGSGAGFPGIPLKIIFPHLQVTLLDALNKRIVFLENVVQELELENVQVIHGRAEDVARTELRESFDICVSRAVSQLNVLCEYCLPFIQLGGLFVAYKGNRTKEELNDSQKSIELLGGKAIMVTDQIRLNDNIKRGFICIEKVSKTDEKYPRRAGKPIKKPL